MRNTKLIFILSSLSADELKEFGKYLSSPLFNTNKTIIRFFNLLKNHYPEYTSRALTMEHMHKKIFPNKKYNPAVIRNLISEMTKISEDFLAYLEFNKDIFTRKKYLLTQLDRKNIERLFRKNLEESYQYLDSSTVRDEFYYFNKYQLQNIERNFYSNKILAGEKESVDKILPEMINNLTNAFIITFLKEYFRYTNVKEFFEIEYRHKFFDVLMKHISDERENYKETPLIFILYIFLSIFAENRNEELAPELKDMIDINKEQMNWSYYQDFYIELYNYYKKKQLLGDKKYGRKSMELIKEMLEKKIFIHTGGYMTAQTFTNIVHAAVRENELEWAENFMNEYRSKLPSLHRNNAYTYNSALVYLKKGLLSGSKAGKQKFLGLALEYLAKVKNDDYLYMLRIKNMQIHIYCELREFETAKNVIAGYKHYLSKKINIPAEMRERYSNYIMSAKDLIRLSLCYDGYALQQLKKKINETKLIEYKGWLLKKIEEIEKNNK